MSLSLEVPPKTIKHLDQIFYTLFGGKTHYLKKVICNPKEQGGLEVLDYNTFNDTPKN